MSYVVGQRSREIGVRVALGATRLEIRRLVLRQACWLALFGTLGGAALALVFGRVVEARLYGVAPTDLPTLAVSALGLAAIALLAGDAPARRAARINPVNALREE
jgi:ABC-type antimicrobial peptide transport system permease subunit